MLQRVAPACLMLTAAVAHAQSAPVARIEMRPVLEARTNEVVLGDLAIIRTQDAGTIRRLVALPLGERPRAGAEAILRRDTIARWVRSRLGIDAADVEWTGAAETVVRSPSFELRAERLEQAARETLSAWVAQNAPGAHAEVMPVARDVTVPAGEVTITPRSLPASIEPDRRSTLWLDIGVDGRVVRNVAVDFMLAARNATATASAAHRLVARGEWVSLRARSGGIELHTRVQALQDGAAGQVVRVRASAATAAVTARVIAAGEVEAEL